VTEQANEGEGKRETSRCVGVQEKQGRLLTMTARGEGRSHGRHAMDNMSGREKTFAAPSANKGKGTLLSHHLLR